MDSGSAEVRPMTTSAFNVNLGIRESEIRLIAITVVSFIGGTMVLFVFAWGVMQVVDRVKARRKRKNKRGLHLGDPLHSGVKERRIYEYKCKKDRCWDHFFRRREARNGRLSDDEDLLLDVEASRTRAMLYSSPGRDRIASLYHPRARHGAQSSELPQIPLPTYSPPALGSSRSSPSFSPPSYRTDESENASRILRARGGFERSSNDDEAFARLRTESLCFEDDNETSARESFSLYSPPPTRIPSPPPPVYTSPAFTSTPLTRTAASSPISAYSSPTFSPSLGMDLDYYMEWSDREGRVKDHLSPGEQGIDQVRQPNPRRYGFAASSTVLSRNVDLLKSSCLKESQPPILLSGSISGASSSPPVLLAFAPANSTHDSSAGLTLAREPVHRDSGIKMGWNTGLGRGSGIGISLPPIEPLVVRARASVPPVTTLSSGSGSGSDSKQLKPILSVGSAIRDKENNPLRSVSFAPSSSNLAVDGHRASVATSGSAYSVLTNSADAKDGSMSQVQKEKGSKRDLETRISQMLDEMTAGGSLTLKLDAELTGVAI